MQHSTAHEFLDRLVGDAGDCPGPVRQLAAAVTTVCTEPLAGDLTTASGLTDRVAVLARVRAVLDAEVGRSVALAEHLDVLPHRPVTFLQRHGQWSAPAASAVLTAARFCDRHPAVGDLWRQGRVATEVVATLARGLRPLTSSTRDDVVAAVWEELPQMSVAAVRVLVSRTLDLLHPEDRARHEQDDWDRRCLVATRHGGMTMITADLPMVEGDAVMAALDALAESLRVAGDLHTAGQRRADALITLVNRAAAHDDVPATSGGLPVGTTITVSLTEADRVASGEHRQPVLDLGSALQSDTDPAGLATTGPMSGAPVTLGDAALRFALCAGSRTGVLVDRHRSSSTPIADALTHTRLEPLAVGRSQRLATAAQRTAMALRDGGCVLCGRPPAECQTHHLTAWQDGGVSDIDNMVLLCWSHHREVDLNRWEIRRNPDPGGSPWLVERTARHRWRHRTSWVA